MSKLKSNEVVKSGVEVAKRSKEMALKGVRKSKELIRNSVSNHGSVRGSLKSVGNAYKEIGLAVPKALGELIKLSPKKALSELAGLISGSATLAGAPISFARSATSSTLNTLKIPSGILDKLTKTTLAVGRALNTAMAQLSDLLPKGGTKNETLKQKAPEPPKETNLTDQILPGIKTEKSEEDKEPLNPEANIKPPTENSAETKK